MSTTHSFCTCCGRKTPWQDLTPVKLTAHHMENLDGYLCGACLLDLDGAAAFTKGAFTRPEFHVTVGNHTYHVARR